MFKKLLNSLISARSSTGKTRSHLDRGVGCVEQDKAPQAKETPKQLAEKKLQKPAELTGAEYEAACAELLRACGWQVDQTPISGDQGVDLVATYRGVKIAIQCKNYNSGKIGNKAVQEIISGKLYTGAGHAVVIGAAE